MGTFYSNCQIHSDSQEAVVGALTKLLKEPAFVSPSVGGWVGVYPEGTRTSLDTLAKQLSKQLSCGVFSWNVHDDDIFYYTLYEEGKRRDEFNSSPDYFEPVSKAEKNRLCGKPEALVQYCLPGISYSQVQAVLHPPSRSESELAAEASAPPPHDIKAITQWLKEQQKIRGYQTASGQADGLAALLGIASDLSALSYRYIKRGEVTLENGELVLVSMEMLSAKNRRPLLWELSMVTEDIKAALDQGADPSERNQYGEPFLLMAAFKGAAEVVQILLDAGADVNAVTTMTKSHGWEEKGVTALMAAVGVGADDTERKLETARILIAAGADVNAKSAVGRSAMEQVQQSLKFNSTQKPNHWGSKYTEMALALGVVINTKLVEMLLAAGAME